MGRLSLLYWVSKILQHILEMIILIVSYGGYYKLRLVEFIQTYDKNGLDKMDGEY